MQRGSAPASLSSFSMVLSSYKGRATARSTKYMRPSKGRPIHRWPALHSDQTIKGKTAAQLSPQKLMNSPKEPQSKSRLNSRQSLLQICQDIVNILKANRKTDQILADSSGF